MKNYCPAVKSRLTDRVQWASTYLRKTGLLKSTRRGHFVITERGKQTLSEDPKRIDLDYLKRFPELEEFRSSKRESAAIGDGANVKGNQSLSDPDTPEEKLEEINNEMVEALAGDLLDIVKSCSPRFFEELVVELLVAMGYGGTRKEAGRAVGQSGDGGIDGVINEDRLGLDSVYIQAKRWEGNVGRPQVQAFAGSLEGFRARKGVLITTSDFSSDAKRYVERIEKRIILISGSQLAKYMIDFNVGVTTEQVYTVKRIDADYFEE